MPNPRGINQYSKGGSAGTFSKGTKSANSSHAGVKPARESKISPKMVAAYKAKTKKK